MAIQLLAQVVMDTDSANSSFDQTRANLNTISMILSKVAVFAQNHPANATFDSTVCKRLIHTSSYIY